MADEERFKVLRLILGPLIRFCVRNTITVNEVLEAVKSVYIDIASEQIESAKEKVTVSRISVMTGITRREVHRIYREGRVGGTTPSVSSRVIGVWQYDPRFIRKDKSPRVLTYGGEDSDFKRLVEFVSKDINPATVLFELERVGVVERTPNGVKLIEGVHYQNKTPEKGFNLLARDFETLGKAVTENILTPQETRNLHIRTEYSNLFRADIPTIRKWVLEQGTEFHRRVREYLAGFDKDMNPQEEKDGGGRVVVQAFSWTEEE